MTADMSRRKFVAISSSATVLAAHLPIGATAAANAATDAPASFAHTHAIDMRINGRPVKLAVQSREVLLDVLRERLQLTGAKKGCNEGACGACTVLIDGRRMNSCLTLAVQCQGRSVTTVEGLASGDALHPVQQAFVSHDAFQCGYCTPGQIVSAVGCIAEGHARSEAQVREWMSGNLCRCSAYPQITLAVLDAAQHATSPQG